MLGENPTIIEYENLFSTFTIILILDLLTTIGFRKSIKKNKVDA